MANNNTVRDIRQMMIFRNKARKNVGSDKTGWGITSSFSHNMNADTNVIDPSSPRMGTYTLNDYNWSQEFTTNPNERVNNDNIPKIILTEFQPERSFNFDEITKALVQSVASMVASVSKPSTAKPDSGIAGGLIAFGKNALKLGAKQAVQTGGTIAQSAIFNQYATPGSSAATTGFAMSFVRGLFTGQYLNVYEIPFFGDDYLIADTKGDWTESGSETMLGKETSQTLKENFNINFPMSPIWKKGDTKKVNWKNTFHLINDTSYNLLRNFKFLNALTSGNFWIQMGMSQQSPNVYDVYCPGRFHQYFSALSSNVIRKGKERENVDVSNELVNLGYKGFSNAENAILFPDAYEIIIECNDLSPNNFNTYMDHMVGHSKVNIGDEASRFGSASNVLKGIRKSIGL